MSTRPTIALEHISQLISPFLQSEEGLSRDEVVERAQGLVLFLELCGKSSRPLTPSIGIDQAWHAFLHHEDAYIQYCNQKFGGKIEHIECDDDNELEDNFLTLKSMWEANFGEESWRRYVSAEAARCADCKSCRSCKSLINLGAH